MPIQKLYKNIESLGTSCNYFIYRAESPQTGEKVLIKSPASQEVGQEAQAQLQYEHGLLQRLKGHNSHFPSAIVWVEEDKSLILKDEGFIFLSEVFKEKPLSLEFFFPLAIKLSQLLAEIHAAGIIFKNINPQSVWIRPEDKAVQIADFSIATELNRTMVPGDPPRLLQGRLEYIAPEQTGRMNRPLTQAADFYSLGILFYEYLSGSVPFTGTEPMTIIFGHMATLPKDLHECNPNLPKSLCAIVMKLLSKMSEDRYKSALGLAVDLEHSYVDWQAGKDALFPLGETDVATRLELPSRLYGREAETQALFSSFNNSCESHENSLLTVSGYSGVGKTSLVRELVPQISLKKGFLASGKFDKFQQSDTYDGLRKALDKLVRYQLSLPEEEYTAFKEMLLEKMGSILGVITDFVPRLRIIVGEPETLPEVSVEATKNRFELAILRFIKLLAQNHPLVLFLDDVQWANPSLFDLLKKLVLSEEIRNVITIVSYRSNEVGAQHPLTQFLSAVESKKTVEKISLEGLSAEALVQLLENMLYLPADELEFLSNLMAQKTDGNPFFLLMLLEELYRENCLYFSLEEKRWLWDEDKITQMSLSDNVLNFVEKRIAKLKEDTKDCLHLAACIGSTFSLKDLALAENKSALEVAESLQAALKESFILSTELKDEWTKGVEEKALLKREYRFQHDKIQQACYELKAIEETNRLHLELARRWAASYQETDANTRVMAIADQFNKGLAYVTDVEEKRKITLFNCQAAEIALNSVAYDISYEYGKMAKNLLSENAWQTDYEFCFKVYLSYIQSAFLSRHFEEATQAAEEALLKAKTNIEKVKLLKLKGDLSRATGDSKAAIAYFEKALSLLGYPAIAKKPAKFDLLEAVIRFKWYLKYKRVPLENLSLDKTEEQKIVLSTLGRLVEEVYYADDVLRYAYILVKWSTATFSQHDQISRAVTYAINALLFPHTRESYILYQQALAFVESYKDSEGKLLFYAAGTLLHLPWHQPFYTVVDYHKVTVSLSEKAGNLEFIATNNFNQILVDNRLPLGVVLSKLIALKLPIQETSARVADVFQIQLRCTLILIGGLELNDWKDDEFDVERIESSIQEKGYHVGLFSSYIFKLRTIVQLDDMSTMFSNVKDLQLTLKTTAMGNAACFMLLAYLYLFLGLINLYCSYNIKEKLKTRWQLFKLHRTLKNWSKLCSENFSHCEVLMRAELAGLKGHLRKALKLYDEAMNLATKHQWPEVACLSAQRALKLCFAHNEAELTYRYANKAVELYAGWGAFGVVKMLQEKYNFYLTPESKAISAQQELTKEDYNARYGLDARSIMLATRVINKEMQLGALLGNVMQLLVENIAATRAALCLLLKGEFWVEAYYGNKERGIETLTHTPWKEAKIAQEVFLQTWREKKEVLVMDVCKSEEFQNSAYLLESEAKSLISVPIFNAEGDTVIGVIYCENKLSTDSFTADRLMALRALAMQMSISIDNSRLYTLFERFVPKPFLNQLGQENIFDLDAGDSVRKDMTVLFMDIRNFTGFSEKRSSEFIFQFINEYLLEVTPLIHGHQGFIDKFLGDGVMALFPAGSQEAVKACVKMQQKIAEFAQRKNEFRLEVGMGLHHGPLMLGIVGERTHIEGTVIGDTVNVASRLDVLNKMFKTKCLLSDAVKNALGAHAHYHLRPVGRIHLLGREESMTVWQLLESICDEKERAVYIEQTNLFKTYYEAYLRQEFKVARVGFETLYQDNPTDGVLAFYIQSCQDYEQVPPPQNWQAEIDMRFK